MVLSSVCDIGSVVLGWVFSKSAMIFVADFVSEILPSRPRLPKMTTRLFLIIFLRIESQNPENIQIILNTCFPNNNATLDVLSINITHRWRQTHYPAGKSRVIINAISYAFFGNSFELAACLVERKSSY